MYPAGAGHAADATVQLRFPLACPIGPDCGIDAYVDVDPGPSARDYTCGALTENGQAATTFRTDPALVAKGLAVLAAAPGTILSVREGMIDGTSTALIEGRACGNTVVIDHGGGWETQYCHLERGSVAVRPGQRVVAGEVLARVGRSGLAPRPRLSFLVRQQGRVIDPFVGLNTGAACGSPVLSLWAPDLLQPLAYRGSELAAAGFATSRPSAEAIEAGEVSPTNLDQSAPALIFFASIRGLREGDEQVIRLVGPDGTVLLDERDQPAAGPQARWLRFAGLERPLAGWEPGTYKAEYYLLRRTGEQPTTVVYVAKDITIAP
ncbi:M23 family metallopeptidase [Zavarzinia sp. CC-PAN008]|uniref:M23 family metallopeptidase n=1 Tax=Zavarzinia sp. CC-PAN008 TaxID=3243332 RepID=UPI003F74A283